VFSSVLIANRGEIACRIAVTCKRLGIRTIAVYSEADSLSPHVKSADVAYCIGPAPALESYLNSEALLSVARESGAEALHPGYGFLSENATFASAVVEAGVTFIGPRAEALRQLSDKLAARRTATGAGFEPVPGSAASVGAHDLGALHEECERIGFPVLIKAAGGGGGIGMQRACDVSELDAALQKAVGIAERSFADGRVYIEKCVERPRHVEIQALRASNGFTAVLGSRECSIQRRYQKLIEECPSPSLETLGETRVRWLENAACKLLELVDYVGVATIELLMGDDDKPYFLEVNARLQVEHTVTEMVYGVDLVELQLQLASEADVSSQLAQLKPRGHAIEARVYAEDPQRGFLPQPGVVGELALPRGSGVRVDCGIEQGTAVTPYYDPLLAKIIGWGSSRLEATDGLVSALSRTKIPVVSKAGLRANNLGFLQRVLGTVEWRQANYDTQLVERLVRELSAK